MKNRHGGSMIIGGLVILVLLVLLAGAGYVYMAPEFEREAPTIRSEENIFWNRSEALKVQLSDNTGLKSFELVLSDGQKSLIVGQGNFEDGIKEQTLLVKYPKSKVLDPKATKLTLKVVVNDKSLWQILEGNKSEKVIDINIDYTKPSVNILANSYSMTQGGSALVVFQAADKNLDTLYVDAAGKNLKHSLIKKRVITQH